MSNLSRNQARIKKHIRIKNKITKSSTLLRVLVYKSHQNLLAQIFDDEKNQTLFALSTRDNKEYSGNIVAAKKLGHEFGKMLIAKKINKIVFDRSGYIYHGRIKAFADALREEGVKF